MPDFWPALVFGGLLIVVALACSVWIGRVPALPESDPTGPIVVRQRRRRLQVNGLLAMTGVMIILIDAWPEVRVRPMLFVALVAVILFLTAWMTLLAVADWLSTQQQLRVTAARLKAQRRQLERELEEVRAAAEKPYPPPEWN
ncbi:MAG: hypothetical protein Q8K78_17240 [Planctomycetaceae bacterium]|nr:hypothetical protein [Planctomycetaceae bacterium]